MHSQVLYSLEEKYNIDPSQEPLSYRSVFVCLLVAVLATFSPPFCELREVRDPWGQTLRMSTRPAVLLKPKGPPSVGVEWMNEWMRGRDIMIRKKVLESNKTEIKSLLYHSPATWCWVSSQCLRASVSSSEIHQALGPAYIRHWVYGSC